MVFESMNGFIDDKNFFNLDFGFSNSINDFLDKKQQSIYYLVLEGFILQMEVSG